MEGGSRQLSGSILDRTIDVPVQEDLDTEGGRNAETLVRTGQDIATGGKVDVDNVDHLKRTKPIIPSGNVWGDRRKEHCGSMAAPSEEGDTMSGGSGV